MNHSILARKAGLVIRNKKKQMNLAISGGCPWDIMATVLDNRLKVSEFEFQLGYYVHFWTKTFVKSINPLISSAK